MIKQNIQKIKGLLKERNYIIPQILYKLYSFILIYSQAIQQKQGTNIFNTVSIYSDIFRLYKKYIVDEPFHLQKLTIQKIIQSQSQLNQSLVQIYKLRDHLSKELPIDTKNNPINQQIVSQMYDLKWTNHLNKLVCQSQLIKQQISKNKNKQNNEMSEMTNLLWYRQYKNQYLIKVDTFVQYFITFCQEYYSVLKFVNVFTRKIFKDLVDPQGRYFITRINVQDFLYKLRQPSILKKIYEFTKQQIKQVPFQSSSSLKIKIFDSKNQKIEVFQINGDKIVNQNGQNTIRNPGIVMMGSAIDNQIVIKSKYISRRQLMIIEQAKTQIKQNQDQNNSHFSLVCLSLTNSTGCKSPKKTKATVGLIFQHEDIKYQILTIQKDAIPKQIQEQQTTLSFLPGEREVQNEQKMTLIILNGINKQKQFAISSYNISKINESADQQEYKISKLLQFSKHFYIKNGVKILLKGANQILENRISKKLRLIKGMEIPLEEFVITIL